VARGMTPMDAIKSASSHAAFHMAMDRDVGAIVPGRYGDIVAVKGDPLADVERLKAITTVIKAGKLVKDS
jgi:imidazolonepropionase-like amidohydrolase